MRHGENLATPAQPAAVLCLARVNVAVMRAPMSDPAMSEFVLAFDTIARHAESSPGFCWHLSGDDGHPVIGSEGGHHQVVNVSVWRDYRSLHKFVYRSAHGRLLLRRRDWFLPTVQPSTALWWVPKGSQPSVDHALARLAHLRRYGPSPQSLSLLRQYDANGLRPPARGRSRKQRR